ncbi:MAG: DUF5666 domain-containing protein [Armatimonadota bacterium]
MKATRLTLICTTIVLLASSAWCAAKANDSESSIQWWGKAPGEKPVVSGIVANVSQTNIAVKTKNGLKPFTVAEKTAVRVNGRKATIADVKVGDPVIVHFKLVNNNVPAAKSITVPRPSVKGKITSISGDIIVLQTEKGEVRVLVNPDTRYRSHGYKGTLADLAVGMKTSAQGDINGNEMAAVAVEFAPAMAKGTVMAIEGNIITVKTVKQLNIALEPSPATHVLIRPRVGPNKPGTLADIKVGMPVNIGFHINNNGPSPLLWIDVLTGA